MNKQLLPHTRNSAPRRDYENSLMNREAAAGRLSKSGVGRVRDFARREDCVAAIANHDPSVKPGIC